MELHTPSRYFQSKYFQLWEMFSCVLSPPKCSVILHGFECLLCVLWFNSGHWLGREGLLFRFLRVRDELPSGALPYLLILRGCPHFKISINDPDTC